MSEYIRSRTPRLPVILEIEAGGTKFEAMFDAHIDSKEEYSVDAPSYPIERDFDTTISTVNHQVQIQMNLFLTPYPVTWASFFGRSIEGVKDTLIRMYWLHCPVTLKTQDETWNNMAIKSMTFKRSEETGDAYDVNIVFTQVRITANQYAGVSRGVMGSGGTPNAEPGISGGTQQDMPQGVSGGELAVEKSEDEEWDDPLRYVIF